MAFFELYWRNISSSAVTPLWVVEHLDVVEDICPGILACCVDLPANSLTLEQLEEALGHSVVMAVAAAAHAGDQMVLAQEVLPVMPSELRALI